MAHNFSNHHILPSSRNGSNDKKNIVRLTNRYHVALHQIFNNMAPDEQIMRVLDIASTALTDEFKTRVEQAVKGSEYVYEEGVLRPAYPKLFVK